MFSLKLQKNYKAPGRFELPISCLLDRRFNQLSHGALHDMAITFLFQNKQ